MLNCISWGDTIHRSLSITDERAVAKVVYVDPTRVQVCGIELAKPENIWGISLPPDDWLDGGELNHS